MCENKGGGKVIKLDLIPPRKSRLPKTTKSLCYKQWEFHWDFDENRGFFNFQGVYLGAQKELEDKLGIWDYLRN